MGGGDSDDDDDDDDDDKHSDSGGLLGGLGLSRKRRRRYLSRRQDDSECKVETLYGTTTVTSDGRYVYVSQVVVAVTDFASLCHTALRQRLSLQRSSLH